MNAIPFAIQAELPLYDKNRPVLRTRPAKAYRHFRQLLKDKERTEEVFRIFEALPWNGMRNAGLRFLTSERGRAIVAREPYLPAVLDDHAALRRMPAGSLAHAYCDFMEREGLTAQGLVDEFALFAKGKPKFHDQFDWYLNRARDVHDMLHVLTGYGRDAVGEQCVLAFTYGQQPSPGNLFISYLGGIEISRRLKSKAPVLRAIREAQKLGAGCPRLVEQSILGVLAMPFDEARRTLNITPATQYAEVHSTWRGMGIDPYDLLAPVQKAA